MNGMIPIRKFRVVEVLTDLLAICGNTFMAVVVASAIMFNFDWPPSWWIVGALVVAFNIIWWMITGKVIEKVAFWPPQVLGDGKNYCECEHVIYLAGVDFKIKRYWLPIDGLTNDSNEITLQGVGRGEDE